MKPRDPKARSLEALQAAMDRHEDERARSAARGPEPWPGDLYALSETAGLPVEWLVVERAASGRCRVVAADTHPALGNADVPVPAEIAGGPLSVRCAVSLEVGIETLRRGERTGAVDPEILDPVRRHLEDLAAGSLDAAPDPELEDWHAEVLAPARAALLPPELKAPGPPPRRLVRRAAALAAILLLLAALGGLSALAWQFHRGELQARSEIDRLVQERQALEAGHQRQLAALREAQVRAQPQRPPEPPPPSPAPLQPLVNLAYASFYPGEARGDQSEIAVPRQATHLFLLFYVGDQEPCREYGLEVARRGASSGSFTVRDLRPLPSQEVSVAIPRTQLPDGSYRLRLEGLCGGERRELAVFEARLKENAR